MLRRNVNLLVKSFALINLGLAVSTGAILSNAATASNLSINSFDFEANRRGPCPNPDSCYSEAELIKHAWQNAFDARIKIQDYIQARRNAKAKIGEILPHINLPSAMSIASKDPLSILGSFFGFLSPARWLAWKQAKYLKYAEGENLKAVFANEVNLIQGLNQNIQMQISNIRILNHWKSLSEDLIKELKDQRSQGARNITLKDIGLVENFKRKVLTELAGQDNLAAYYPLLSQALGLEFDQDWLNIHLEPVNIEAIDGLPDVQQSEFFPRAKEAATETKAIDFMVKAAEKEKKALGFSPIDFSGGASFGYGYIKELQIIDSQIKELGVQKQQTLANIYTGIANNVNNLNVALAQFRASKEGQVYLEDAEATAIANILDKTVPLDVVNLLLYLENSLQNDLQMSSTYYTYRTCKANLERYAWEGHYYEKLLEYLDEEVLSRHKSNIVDVNL